MKSITHKAIKIVIESSGYPLQLKLARLLHRNFVVQEEWCYLDKSTAELRTIDLVARKNLDDRKLKLRLRPKVTILIECKQSDLPYVFFLGQSDLSYIDFPIFAGLKNNELLALKIGKGSCYYPISVALGLNNLNLISKPHNFCFTFSKIVRKGKEFELSGADVYNSTVLPVLGAMLHQQKIQEPKSTFRYFDFHAVFGVVVLDAPMIGVQTTEKRTSIKNVDWVRVLRHEYKEAEHSDDRSRLYAIDFVSRSFFEEYMNSYIQSFVRYFSKISKKSHRIIAEGAGGIRRKNYKIPDDSKISENLYSLRDSQLNSVKRTTIHSDYQRI